MALISCPECSKEVSSAAPQCPNCGYPLSQPAEHPTQQPPDQIPPASTYAQATQTAANTPQQPTHIVIHQPAKEFKGLARAGWILIFLVCGVALIPFLGFASWLVAGPIFLVTFIISIMVLSRGGTLEGILLLFTSIIVGPVFIACAPFVSSFLGLARVGQAVESKAIAKIPPKTEVTSSNSPATPQATSTLSPILSFESPRIGGTPTFSPVTPDNAGVTYVRTQQTVTVDERPIGNDKSENVALPDNVVAELKRPPDSVKPPKIDRLPGERFPQTRLYALAPSDLNHFDNNTLRYAINEMYARHGADFKNDELKRTFTAFDWYQPVRGRTYDQTDALFTTLETENLKLLGQVRDDRKSGVNRGDVNATLSGEKTTSLPPWFSRVPLTSTRALPVAG